MKLSRRKMLAATAGGIVTAAVTGHAQNGAVDNTFVQFYPTLMEVARRMGTVRPTFVDTPVPSH